MIRREVLTGLMALAATPAFSADGQPAEPGLQLGGAQPFETDFVIAEAKRLACLLYTSPSPRDS